MIAAAMSPDSSDLRAHWTLDENVVFLNHGSFGACPRVVLEHQANLRAHMESEPVRFFMREYEGRMDEARASLARLVSAPPSDLVFVPNATTGVNSVLRSLELSAGDELLVSRVTPEAGAELLHTHRYALNSSVCVSTSQAASLTTPWASRCSSSSSPQDFLSTGLPQTEQ